MAEQKTDINDILNSMNPDKSEQDDESVNKDEENVNQEGSADDENTKNAAFAKMRVENKSLKTQVDTLQQQLEEINKKIANPNQTKTEKQDNKDEQTELEKRLAKIEAQLELTSQELVEEKLSKKRDIAIANLTSLRDTYKLQPNDLVQFAEDAEARGINLANEPEKMKDYYRLLYMDKIVASEVERALKEKGLNPGASTGPKGQTKNQGSGLSINEIIAQAEKAKK